MIKNRKRVWALLLSAALIVTQLPAVAMAENAAPEDKVNFAVGEREDALGYGSIASFEELPSGVANQTVDVGTELSALNLPGAITASVYNVTEDMVIPDEDSTEESDDPTTATPSDADKSVSDNNAGVTSVKDSGKTVTTITTSGEQIPVTWDSEPAYDGDTEGSYVFTADVSGYVLSGSAKLPQITVTVAADTVEKPTGESLPCTQTEGCTLANGHEGDCVPAPPSNDSLVKTITSWTFVDDENLNEGVLPLINVSMEQQVDFDTVVSMLPTQLSAVIEGETEPAPLDITDWICPEYIPDGEGNWPLTGDYTFTAALTEGYACDPLPTVKVLLGGANTFDANNSSTEGGLTVAASEGGEVEYTEGSGFTLKASGTYEISGEWNGNLDTSGYNEKAVITVPAGVTANVTLNSVTITNISGTHYACAFAVEAGGTANITLAENSTNTLTSGRFRAGLEVPQNAKVTIDGDGSLTANCGNYGAGIGGGSNGSGGNITISGGTVEASSTYGAGIGGGGSSGSSSGGGGNIEINGGTVTASSNSGAGIGGGESMSDRGGDGGTIRISSGTVMTSSNSGAGIGGGYGGGISGGGAGTWGGDGGQFTIDGNAVVFATSNQAAQIGGGRGGSDGTKTLTEGVVFEGDTGTVHGSPELPGNLTIPDGSTLTVPNGSMLTILDGTPLTNNGTITNNGTVENNGTVSGSGSITNNGKVNDNSGGISVTVTGIEANKPSEVKISFWNSQDGQITQATYGDTITIQAKVTQKNTRLRKAALNEVIFKIGSTELGTASVTNGTATLSFTLTGDSWKPDNYTITAEYGGGAGLLPNDTGTANLTVKVAEMSSAALQITAPATGAKPEMTATVDGGAGYTVQKAAWSGALTADGSFGYNTVYTAEITLSAKQYYRFADPVTGTINGQTASVSRISDTEAILSYTFDKTASKPTWTVTVNSGTSDKTTASEGETVAITAGSAPAGQTFDKWATADGVTFANENATSTTFLMPAKAVTVTATYKALLPHTYAVTVENGTGDGSYTKGATVNIAADNAPSGKVFERWTADSTDIIFDNPNSVSTSFIMPEHTVTVTANFKDNPSGGGESSYSEPQPQSSCTVAGDNISRSVSRSDLKKLADSGKSLTLRCDKTSMTFEPAAMKAILAAVPATAGNITFSAVPADLSAFPDAAKLIGAHPVYDFTISYKDSKGNPVVVPVNFPAGSASVSINYTPAAAEVTGSLFMVCVDGKGAVTWLDKSSYDSGRVLAEIPHFSTYGVAYKAPAPVFTDIGSHWAKADIEFVAARGLLSGTGNNLFSPDDAMTRGMFVTALGRLAGVDPDSYKTRSFTDVKADAYYAAYVEWAAQKNIVKGTGEGLFSPDTPVTREQMAVMMVNYAGQMGYSIPTPLAAVTFADNDRISTWAAKEVAAMQRAGIIKGKDGNRFDPQASATRAGVSAVLRRFVEIVIDPVTAQGWGKNDSGQWLYYKDGKALTGWKQIGSKWYYFDKNGIMAVNTKVDGYEIGPDGARKEDN